MTEALKVYRRSELESADCLARYKAIWQDGLDDATDYALRGIAFHKIKHVYIEKLVEAGVAQDFELAGEAFVQGIAEARTPARLIPEVRDLWERHAPHFELDLARLVAVEERQEGGGFIFTPDYVYAHPERNELEINDDKTFFSALTEAQARLEFQPRFYIRQAMDRWPGFSSYRFTYHFIRLGVHLSLVFTAADMGELDREVAALVAQIEHARDTDTWPANPGPQCTYCQLRCPLVDQGITMPKRIETVVIADQLGAWLLAADRMVRDGKKALKQFCTVYGPVNVNGVVWDNRQVLQRSYPIDAVLQLLRERGLMGAFEGTATEGPLTISHSSLTKVFKRYPDLEKDLAAVLQQKRTYRFGAQKPGAEDGEED